MLTKTGLFVLLFIALSNGGPSTADVVYERNPHSWQNPNVILYNYKGLFDPVVDNVTAAYSELRVNYTAQDVNTVSLSREIKRGVNLLHTLEVDKTRELHGILSADKVVDGFIVSELLKKLYLHSFYDCDEQPGVFNYTIKIGPSPQFIAKATVELIDWIDNLKSANKDIHFEGFFESSYASERIVGALKKELKSRHQKWSFGMNEFKSSMLSGVTVSDAEYLWSSRISGEAFFDKDVPAVRTKTRVLILVGSVGLIRHATLSLYKAVESDPNLSWKEFTIIAIPSTLHPLPSYKAVDQMNLRDGIFKKSDDNDAQNAFKNMFAITEEFDTDRYEEISAFVKEHFYDGDEFLEERMEPLKWTHNRPVPLWSGHVHDATLLLLMCIASGEEPTDYFKLLAGSTWEAKDLGGIQPFSGKIKIGADGERITNLIFSQYDKKKGWETVAKYNKLDFLLKEKSVSAPSIDPGRCGYQGCLPMSDDIKLLIILLFGVIVFVILFIILFAICWRRNKQEKDLLDMGWTVDYTELQSAEDGDMIFDCDESELSGEGNMQTHAGQGVIKKSVSLESLDLPDGKRLTLKNTPVFVKPLLAQFFIDMDRELMKELKNLKDLRDEFIVSVLGLTRELDHYWLVLEDCSKGSLENTLQDDNIELDSNFKVSMIDDIAKGMHYLHYKSHLGSHGNLKTSNILISSNFTMKIADFGRSIFLSDMKKAHHHTEIEYNKRMLWRAPELLRKKRVNVNGTKPGDVYSFAVIVHEIITRQGPFNLHSLDNKDTPTTVILKVKNDEEQFRPEFPENIKHKPLNVISMYCTRNWWHMLPENRSSFKTIVSTIRKYKPGRSTGTFLDTAVKRLEKFSGALEKKSKEKEEQAKIEEKKYGELIELFVPQVIIKKGVEDFMPETIHDTTVAVIELFGTKGGEKQEKVAELETRFRNILDAISAKSGFFFGNGPSSHRLWVASRNCSAQHSHLHAIVKVVQHVMKKMEEEISHAKMSDFISMKAGMDTGTISTGLVVSGTTSAPKFDFVGVIEVADRLCTVASGFEILVSPQSHKEIQQIQEKDIVMDFGTKQQIEQGGAILEAFLLYH